MSTESNPKLSEQIERTQVDRELAQSRSNREREQRREEERRQIEQAQKEFDDYQRQQQALQDKEIALQQSEAQKQAIRDKYASERQTLISQRDQAISDSKKDNSFSYQPLIKSLNSRIEATRTNEFKEISFFEYSQQYPGRPITQNESKQFQGLAGSKYAISLVDVIEQRQASRDAQTAYRVASSKKTAQSEAVREQEKLEFTIRAFEDMKDKSPQGFGVSDTLSRYKLTQATKTKPGIKSRDYFLTPEFENPLSIIGTTEEKSRQAVSTFDTTEEQQQKLFWEVTRASNPKEATEIKTRYQESNPYVGTPQLYLKKGEIIDSQGVLIEKKLLSKFPTSYSPIATSKDSLVEQTPISITKERQSTIQPTEYLFLDDQGNTVQPSREQLWLYSKYLNELQIAKPSQTDQVINQYMQENMDAIIESEGKLEDGSTYPLIDMKKDSFQAGVLGHADELYATGYNVLNPENQIESRPTLEGLAFTDLIKFGTWFPDSSFRSPPDDYQLQKVLQEKSETPEGLEFIAGSIAGSIVIAGGTAIIPGLALAKYGKYFVQPKTYKKAQELALQIFKKEEKALYTEPYEAKSYLKTKGKVTTKDQPKQESVTYESSQIEGGKVKISRPSNYNKPLPKPTHDPFTVEMIDPKTAIIYSGTEFIESKTPYIVYKVNARGTRGKAVTKIYRPIDSTDVMIPDNEIIIRGEQGTKIVKTVENKPGTIMQSKQAETTSTNQLNELRGRQQITNKISTYPTTKENLAQVSDPASLKYLAPTGTMKEVLTKDIEAYPKEVVKSIGFENPKSGSIILETERLSKQAVSKGDESYKGGLGQKAFADKTKDLPDAGSLIKTKKVKSGSSKSFTEGKFSITGDKPTPIDLSKPSSSKTIEISKTDAPAQRREQLKQIAKDIGKEEGKYDFSISNMNKGISSLGSKVSYNTSTKYEAGTRQESKQAQSLRTDQLQVAKSSLESKQDSLLSQKDILDLERIRLEKEKPVLDPRYSLIVKEGEKTDQGLVPRYIVTTKEKTIPRLDIPKDPKTTTTKTPPGLTVDLGEPKLRNKKQSSGLKPKPYYFSWNVDEKRPGGYLGGKELRVGKTKKVISQTAKAQRRADKIAKQKQKSQFNIFKNEAKIIRRSGSSKPTKKQIKTENIVKLDPMLYKKGNKKKVFGIF